MENHKTELDGIIKTKGAILEINNRSSQLDEDNIPILPGDWKETLYRFVDPLQGLNFRILFDDDDTGLLGGMYELITKGGITEKWGIDHPNCAISYLSRIGDYENIEVLRRLLISFYNLVNDYEFLVSYITGLDECLQHNPDDPWTDNKIEINFRETIDSKVQSILATMKSLLYDTNRSIYRIPNNLCKLRLKILVYQTGYFASDLYDPDDDPDKEFANLFPTVKKLNFRDSFTEDFNFIHHIFDISGNIDLWSTATKYFENISNENETGRYDIGYTNLVLNITSFKQSSNFKQILGDINYEDMLVKIAAHKKLAVTYDIIKQQYIELLSKEPKAGMFQHINSSWGANFVASWGDYVDNVGDNILKKSKKYLLRLEKYKTSIEKSINKMTDPKMLASFAAKLTNQSINQIDTITWKKFDKATDSIMLRTDLFTYGQNLLLKLAKNSLAEQLGPQPFGDTNNQIEPYQHEGVGDIEKGVSGDSAKIEKYDFVNPQLFDITKRKKL